MIIKATVFNMRYSYFISDYFKNFQLKNYYRAIQKKKLPEEYRKKREVADLLLEETMFWEERMTNEDKEKFKNIIKESLIDYIQETLSENDAQYFKQALEIKLDNTLEHKNYNGELVCYFLQQNVSIIL